jgi:hypothetical protein
MGLAMTIHLLPLAQPTRGGGETPPGQPAGRQRSAPLMARATEASP